MPEPLLKHSLCVFGCPSSDDSVCVICELPCPAKTQLAMLQDIFVISHSPSGMETGKSKSEERSQLLTDPVVTGIAYEINKANKQLNQHRLQVQDITCSYVLLPLHCIQFVCGTCSMGANLLLVVEVAYSFRKALHIQVRTVCLQCLLIKATVNVSSCRQSVSIEHSESEACQIAFSAMRSKVLMSEDFMT